MVFVLKRVSKTTLLCAIAFLKTFFKELIKMWN